LQPFDHQENAVKLFAIIVALAGLFSSASLFAQVNEKFADHAGEIELLRSMAQTERQAVVAGNLTLTADEGQRFWPLYNQYRADVSAVQDKRVKVITDYAAKYQTLTDSDARKLLNEYLGYQSAFLKLRERYVDKFSKVLPGTKLARFFQIENKLDALTDLTIVSNIPLTK
jgi:hypothetical protein